MVFHNRPFKKDLTPFAGGGKVVKHIGKGATEQSAKGGSTLTGGDPFARMANRYPKQTPAPPPSTPPGLGGPSLGSSPPPPMTPPTPPSSVGDGADSEGPGDLD